MSVAISSTGLGKQFQLGAAQQSGQLRDALTGAVRRWFRPAVPATPGARDLWALDDVSFEINHGDIVGIVGRNGSGKSTLLKILARVTEPTRGAVDVYGRVGSLLEVGTGFHPELTGRENVFVNGAILGMGRAEIARKFDEIVHFAEVERFIDTPVKHYSSGMQVRLAFAVAAHLEPEILLVDEVLAVGDTAFQKRCLGKMGDVARQGRTVLFVSHDLTAVQMLCHRAILLSRGRVTGDGPAGEQIQAYLREARADHDAGRGDAVVLSPSLRLPEFGFSEHPVVSGRPAEFRIEVASTARTRVDELAVLIHDSLNRRVGIIDFRRASGPYYVAPGESLAVVASMERVPLVEGEYRLGISLRTNEAHHIDADLSTVDVVAGAGGEVVPYAAAIRGVVAFDYQVALTECATASSR